VIALTIVGRFANKLPLQRHGAGSIVRFMDSFRGVRHDNDWNYLVTYSRLYGELA